MNADAAARRSITVVVGGSGPAPTREPPPASAVIAADAGLLLANTLGLRVDHVVGDLDSVGADAVERAVQQGAIVHRHEADKDATDSALALDLAMALLGDAEDGRPGSVTLLGRGGGRLDHLLADLLVLGAPALAAADVTAHLGPATISVVRPGSPRRLAGRAGEQVSLLPLNGVARGVTTAGLRWALTGAGLSAGTTRGLSNEFVARGATVAIEAGVVLAVQPGTIAPSVAPRAGPYDPSPDRG